MFTVLCLHVVSRVRACLYLQDAEKSLRFYRNVSKDTKSESKAFEDELSKLNNSHQLMLQSALDEVKEKLTISDFGNFELI